MIRFAALLAALPDPDALARYAAEVGAEDATAAEALLSGKRATLQVAGEM